MPGAFVHRVYFDVLTADHFHCGFEVVALDRKDFPPLVLIGKAFRLRTRVDLVFRVARAHVMLPFQRVEYVVGAETMGHSPRLR